MMIKFQGRVDAVIFENSKNFFKILSVSLETKIPDWVAETITVTGNFGAIELDSLYEFSGQLVQHERFGEQFKCDEYHEVLPHETAGLVKYLSGDNFVGIGVKTAETIIASLGDDVINKIKANPAVVDSLDISKRQKETLRTEITSMDTFSDSLLSLTQIGLSKRMATQIYQKYQGDAVQKFRQNPYLFISKLQGFGFKTADNVGHNLGFSVDSAERIQGALLQILQDALNADGNSFVSNKLLLEAAMKLLNSGKSTLLTYDQIAIELNHLAEQEIVVIEGEQTFLKQIFETEWAIAQQIAMLQKRELAEKHYSDTEIADVIKQVERKLKISYDETQKSAIKQALANPIFLLTGGPGTGKTTIIAGILLAFRILEQVPEQDLFSADTPFLLAAPTGRAAKRMTETTGIEAKTIHRLLGLGHENTYLADDLNEINGKVLIVDEMSMVDMYLFKLLLSAINETPHIIFVGDKDQLPSVGPGNIFSDLIKSNILPTVALSHVHRQDDDSSIIDLAHEVNTGLATHIFSKTINSSFIASRPDQIDSVIPQIVALALKRGFHKDDIQILGSMYKSDSGIYHLNRVLQNQLNPRTAEHQKFIERDGQEFRIGDRVLQLANNPEKDIYNGQIGQIISINYQDTSKYVVVNFDGNEVNLSKLDLNDLTLAYAITIHKAQGSEFPLVILSLTMQNYRMLRRNLLYTAITRARDSLVMVGDKRAYEQAIATPGNERDTALVERIRALLGTATKSEQQNSNITVNSGSDTLELRDPPEEEQTTSYLLTKQLIIENAIDPMIGMAETKLKAEKN